jgi:hypothetical protein
MANTAEIYRIYLGNIVTWAQYCFLSASPPRILQGLVEIIVEKWKVPAILSYSSVILSYSSVKEKILLSTLQMTSPVRVPQGEKKSEHSRRSKLA